MTTEDKIRSIEMENKVLTTGTVLSYGISKRSSIIF